MSYWLECVCGSRVEVTATQAGTKAPCGCGKLIDVPRLSVLRRQEGSGAPEVTPELVIHRLYCEGGRPVGGGVCMRCGTETVDRMECVVECEKPWVKREHAWPVVLVLLLCGPLIALLVYLLGSRSSDVVREGKSYRVALSLCSVCQSNMSPTNGLRQVLERDVDFARLVEKYPRAKIERGSSLVG